MKFYTQLKKAVLEQLAADPTQNEGRVWYDTAIKGLKFWNDSAVMTAADLNTTQTLKNKAIESTTKLEPRHGTRTELESYASGATDGQLLYDNTNKAMVYTADGVLAAMGGGSGSTTAIDVVLDHDVQAGDLLSLRHDGTNAVGTLPRVVGYNPSRAFFGSDLGDTYSSDDEKHPVCFALGKNVALTGLTKYKDSDGMTSSGVGIFRRISKDSPWVFSGYHNAENAGAATAEFISARFIDLTVGQTMPEIYFTVSVTDPQNASVTNGGGFVTGSIRLLNSAPHLSVNSTCLLGSTEYENGYAREGIIGGKVPTANSSTARRCCALFSREYKGAGGDLNRPGIVDMYHNSAIISTLTSPNEQNRGYFGEFIEFSPDGYTVAIAATGENYVEDRAGRVYIYTWDINENSGDGGWVYESTIVSPQPEAYSHFGSSIAFISNDHLFIGSPGDTGTNDPNMDLDSSGSFYQFKKNGISWDFVKRFHNPTDNGGEYYGERIVSDGANLICSAHCPMTERTFFIELFTLKGDELVSRETFSYDDFPALINAPKDIVICDLTIGTWHSYIGTYRERRGLHTLELKAIPDAYATETKLAGETCSVLPYADGYLDGFTGLTTGTKYYYTFDGRLVTDESDNNAEYIGIAVSDTTIVLGNRGFHN